MMIYIYLSSRQVKLSVVAGSAMSSEEAAQTVFARIERPMRKYLRITRRQPWHSRDSVLPHLLLSLKHSLSARAFLEPFLTAV